MFFALTIIALSISHFLASRELVSLKAKHQKLNHEIGNLTLGDANDFHVLSLPSPGRNSWRWKISLPAGNKYWLRWKVAADIPADGLPPLPEMEGVNTFYHTDFNILDPDQNRIAPGEPFILDVTVGENTKNEWAVTCATETTEAGPRRSFYVSREVFIPLTVTNLGPLTIHLNRF